MKTSFCLLGADSKEDVIRLYGVTESGEPVIVHDKCMPYFYVLPKNSAAEKKLKSGGLVKKTETVIKMLGPEKKEFLKVYVDLPQNIQHVRDSIKNSPFVKGCYEYAITFYKR